MNTKKGAGIRGFTEA